MEGVLSNGDYQNTNSSLIKGQSDVVAGDEGQSAGDITQSHHEQHTGKTVTLIAKQNFNI